MDKSVTHKEMTAYQPDLKHYESIAVQLEQLKQSRNYDRITTHDVNNSLGKINNALWLMAREVSASTPLFRTCQQIVEREITAARNALSETETLNS